MTDLMGERRGRIALVAVPIIAETRALVASLVAAALLGMAGAAPAAPPPKPGQVVGEPPLQPSVATMAEIGVPGGELHMLAASTRDTRLLVVYGYARLVGYDLDLNLVPDILDAVEIEDGRIFTLRLREGHRWSDGAPFTTEDFRYYWEDVANDEQLSPFGPPWELLVDGEAPLVEILDPLTVRYSWSTPNPYFLPSLAAARPLFLYRPAHYLKQFHGKYADPKALEHEVRKDQARDWAQLHGRRDRIYRYDNPALPTLQPWMIRTRPPARRLIAERNPF
jgi:peptide/nickel transport system substrate-binding protein